MCVKPLRVVPLYATRLERYLRCRRRASRMSEVRRRKVAPMKALPAETKMRNSPQHLRNSAAKRCAMCEGQFGLVRYYTWRTAMCSKKCRERFKAREEGDRRWLDRLKTTF
jgi:hypothetical protein